MIVESSPLPLDPTSRSRVIFDRCRNTCDLSPVSSGPLCIAQSESPLAAPRDGTSACRGVSRVSTDNAQARGVGKFRAAQSSQHYLVLEQRLRRRPGCRRLAALTTALAPRTAPGPRGRTASRSSLRWTRAARPARASRYRHGSRWSLVSRGYRSLRSEGNGRRSCGCDVDKFHIIAKLDVACGTHAPLGEELITRDDEARAPECVPADMRADERVPRHRGTNGCGHHQFCAKVDEHHGVNVGLASAARNKLTPSDRDLCFAWIGIQANECVRVGARGHRKMALRHPRKTGH